MYKEKRKERRIKEENRVVIEIPGRGGPESAVEINALTQDISLGGARILMMDEFLPVGSFIKMTLYLSRSRQLVKVHGRVRWARTIENGFYEMGVEFEHGIPASVMALINHLYKKEQAVPAAVETKPAEGKAG
ncbi:MAG TPA: PilZ domain-containing protein [Methanomicrobiales archaeon]|nr:PilZ domain-containing protein [Methanomicrobiales archaeon]